MSINKHAHKTTRRLETRMKEHQDACCRGMLVKSAVAEHAWKHHHPIKWQDTRVIDRTRRPKELQLKEALHIQTSTEELLNQDIGLEVPGCWLTALRRQGTTNHSQAWVRDTVRLCACLLIDTTHAIFLLFALTKARAAGRNVGNHCCLSSWYPEKAHSTYACKSQLRSSSP